MTEEHNAPLETPVSETPGTPVSETPAKIPTKKPSNIRTFEGYVGADQDTAIIKFGAAGYIAFDTCDGHVTMHKDSKGNWWPHEKPLKKIRVTVEEISSEK